MSDSWQPHGLHGILQARILEWVAFPFSRVPLIPQPRDQIQVSRISGDSLPAESQGKPNQGQKSSLLELEAGFEALHYPNKDMI